MRALPRDEKTPAKDDRGAFIPRIMIEPEFFEILDMDIQERI